MHRGGVPGVVSGGDNLLDNLNVHVYPNPASDQSFVMFNKAIQEDYDWEVYSQLGQIVENGKVRKGSQGFSLSTNNYASGIYMIKVAGVKGVLYSKLLVAH